jgi:hypothetical protein
MTLLGTLAGAAIDLRPQDQFANLGAITITGLISAAIVLILVVAALVFFFMLIFGGIKYITSGGDKAQTEAARGTITAALIGLVIVFAAWAIITLVNAFFGINILDLTLPTAGA